VFGALLGDRQRGGEDRHQQRRHLAAHRMLGRGWVSSLAMAVPLAVLSVGHMLGVFVVFQTL
jgi:hypothetical protein